MTERTEGTGRSSRSDSAYLVFGVAIAAYCALLTPARVRAEADIIEPAPPTEVRAPFTLLVNHAKKGEMTVLLKDDDVFVRRSDLIEAGVTVPTAASEVVVEGEPLLSLKSMCPPLSYELDENTITLSITAPISLLPSATLDFAGRPPDVVYQKTTSAFVNYAPRINEQGHINMYEETGVSIDGNLLFSSAYLSSTTGPVRGLSNFLIDDHDKLQRITLGDAMVLTGPLGSGHFVGGVTIARRFELDPYVMRAPSLGYVGTTMTPATLDVYVNGSRVRSEDLQPGTFRLDNLRVGGGAGIATYVVRDVFGHEETINAPFYVSDGVLRKGLQDYTYSAGALRNRVGTASWDYGQGAVLGRHRIGINDYVTVGGRAEASGNVISAGPSVTMLTPIGQVELELGMSRDTAAGTGLASFLSYGYTSRRFGAGVFGTAVTNRYATADRRAKEDRATSSVGVYEATPVGRNLTFSVQGSYSHYRDRGTSLRGTLQSALRLGRRSNVFATASKARNEDGSAPWELLVTFNYSFADRLNAATSARVSDGHPSVLFDANRSLPVGEGYGYRVSALKSDHSNLDALVQYQALFGRYSVDAISERGANHVTAEAAGGLALVPGVGLFPTLPVQDGFAVIRVAGVKHVRGYVNNQELGRTDRNGNLLVPNLISYYGNHLSIAQEDVPIQYGLEVTDMTLAPPARGAAIADFALTIPHYYRGHAIIDEHGTQLVPKYGDVRVTGRKGEISSPIGEEGEFELEGIEAGKRTFAIDYTGGTCELTLDIGDSDDTVIDLGVLTCKMP